MNASPRVRSEWRELAVDGQPMRAYLASAVEEPRAAVLVLQEAFGVNAHIQSIANRLASTGFLALAPDLFHRSGEEVVEYEDRSRAMGLIGELGAEQIAADVGTAVAAVRAEAPALPVAVVGFCFGGRAAFTSACLVDGIEAAAVFYGPGIAGGSHAVLDHVEGIDARMLLLYGEEDPTIPAEDRAAIEAALEAAGVDFSSVVYPDAGHAFSCDARPAMFRAGPALDAWTRLLAFLPAG